jgi:hypothetical protein
MTFPFSAIVPHVMRELHRIVVYFFLFASRNPHLGSHGEAVCQAVCRAYDVIGTKLMLEANRMGSETPLSKPCQISIDCALLASASDYLWAIIEPGTPHHMSSCLDEDARDVLRVIVGSFDLHALWGDQYIP